MKLTYSLKNNTGFGLVEVMVTVVVSVGLLAVAALQGDLIGGSRTNKTRTECKILANNTIEALRDRVEKTGSIATTGHDSFESLSNLTENNISGITETFSRVTTVTTLTDPARKQLDVTVSWGGGGSEKQCVVQSVIAYTNPGSSILAADAGVAIIKGPSPNANSSIDIAEYEILTSPATPGAVVSIGSQTYIAQEIITRSDGTDIQKGVLAPLCSLYSPALISFEQPVTFVPPVTFAQKLKTRRIDYDSASGGALSKEAIELFEVVTISSTDYCIPRVRYNGGVIIPISGTVYSKVNTVRGNRPIELLSVDLFTFNVSESGTYCIFEPASGATSAPYTCYVGGNCEYGPSGTLQADGTTTANSGDETIATQCPNPAISAEEVGPGGWRGKVGLLGIAANNYNVCFAEEVAAEPATLDTARNYFTRYTATGVNLNQGINKSYQCHDLFIITGQSTNLKVHEECAKWADATTAPITHSGDDLASKTIQRNISGNNVFDPAVDTNLCNTTSYH